MKQSTALGILKTGRNVYLTGAAGSGKTHVLNQYIMYLKKHNVGIGVTASTGIAATHLNGMTIHSWSGIGIKDFLSEWDIDSLTQRQPLAKRYMRTDVLIVDEVSMLRPEIIDMLDMLARAMKRVDKPFGGIQVIFSGDFFQLPPIVRGGDSAFADSSHAWIDGDLRVCYLTEQYRQGGGKLLSILNDIRDGELSEASSEALQSRLIDAEHEADVHAVVLHTHNNTVNERNSAELSKLKGESKTYQMTSSGRANLVEGLKKSVLAPEELKLKIGARVMFVKNSPDQEYVNGTLGEIKDMKGEYPVVKTNNGKEIIAYPMSWETTDDGRVLASVTQVPLRLAWAITVHKSQGMSLDAVEVDLSRAFTPGQGYVALSRARELRGLILRGFNDMALQVHPYVRSRDEQLQAESVRWEHVFEKFSPEKITELHKIFIDTVGKTEAQAQEKRKDIPTHLKTRALLAEGKTIQEIQESRGLTYGTIVGHLEKLKDAGDSEIFAHVSPQNIDFKDIKKAFEKMKDNKLAPVHKKLNGKYTYDELRLVRVFL